MKKIIICLMVVSGSLQFSCKKFLDITPIDKLTGNNFYQSVQDIEANINDMYGSLYQKYTNTNTAGATGEFRSGEVIPAAAGFESGNRNQIAQLGGHTRQAPNPNLNLSRVEIPPANVVNDRTLLNATGGIYNFQNLRVWNEYYRIIQSANLLVDKLEEGIPALNAEQTKRYVGEAKFIRNWCYFFMVRLYGDVVYYTNAYQKDALPRENQVSVMNKCIADMKSSMNDLPVFATDPTTKAVRATAGAAKGLIMNMNMWNAGFDPTNKAKYYEETATLGLEVMNSGAYRLMPLEDWDLVTKGRSDESLFELYSPFNYTTSGNPIR
ncbi:MAG: RagB/SusD family nutrient uptake outer membrane protein, partial [Pedobacter sp.]